jgi:uridine phosphorylase
VGKLILVESAVRDEGLSYHYVEPGREIMAQPQALSVLRAALQERGLPFVSGKTWTTTLPTARRPLPSLPAAPKAV